MYIIEKDRCFSDENSWIILIKPFFVLISIFLTIFGYSIIANAESTSYLVRPVFSDNQVDTEVGYFDLLVTPGSEQTLAVEIKNQTNEMKVIKVYTTDAKTNPNAIIDYSQRKDSIDSSILSQYLTIEDNEVELHPNETKKVLIQLNVPEEPFKGVILGGLYFEEKQSENKEAIQNKVAYSLAIQLRENFELLEENIIFHDLVYRLGYLCLDIENDQSRILGKLEFNYSIRKKGTNKEIVNKKILNRQLAPNDCWTYMINLKQENLPVGEYELDLSIHSQTNVWKYRQTFSVLQKQILSSEKNNLLSIMDNHDYSFFWLVVALMCGILMVFRKKDWKINK